MVIDAEASDEQAEKLGAVFSGASGGPMQALAPLLGEHLGLGAAPIDLQRGGAPPQPQDRGFIDVELENIVPFGVETGEPARLTGIFHPAGSELAISHATRWQISAFGRFRGQGELLASSSPGPPDVTTVAQPGPRRPSRRCAPGSR